MDRLSAALPAPVKDAVRRFATRLGRRAGELPGIEFLGTHLMQVFARLRVDCVLDVGAHVGRYGRFLRNLGYRHAICSFEPVRESFEMLARRAAADSRWTAHDFALGARAELAPMNVAVMRQFSSFAEPSEYSHEQFGSASAVEHVEMVQVRRLGSVLEQVLADARASRPFLKLDTQGHDMDVLEGAGSRIASILGLQVELSVRPIYRGAPSYLEVLPRLDDMGFALSGVFPVTRDKEHRVVEVDAVLFRSDPPLSLLRT